MYIIYQYCSESKSNSESTNDCHAALSDLAQHEGKSLGEFLRELARDRIRQARRLSFEREAQRQSIAAAAAAGRPGTDEHAVMQELDDDLESFGDEWT